ncbi:unnamed protein product [Ceutorhynchus assimilis]|uniref:DH domain-containing protein n=1 Tax=Ceutorhynchus assimilis TaxID=467358 RepID=A0A9N9MMR7_9CUCU|nr:unnamed protein product [Ceutorhynchus assimilis]
MAASSKKPSCTLDDGNSICLNSEALLLLHQIFLEGLTARLESSPPLVLGDLLLTMLLPKLNIYQEYVRNHHYSLQVLTECMKIQPFAAYLKILESKPMCKCRSLETFLNYPMQSVPRYIRTLRELLAHTPLEHVERKTLEAVLAQLENLSKQIHDEVSETENLRKNLAVERMIVEGCDILLDVEQTFVRKGDLIQILIEKPKERVTFKKIESFRRSDKDVARECFLFSYHLIVTTSFNIKTLDTNRFLISDRPCESASSVTTEQDTSYQGRDFKVVVLCSKNLVTPVVIHFVAPTLSDKAAWISDLANCMNNAQFREICKPLMANTSSINLP